MSDELKRLNASLTRAGEVYRSRPRDGAWRALVAIHRHLVEAGVSRSDLLPVWELLGALQDADAGVKNPLTYPETHRPGARKKPLLRGIEQAAAAVVVTLLVDAGETTVRDACRAVAKATKVLPADRLLNLRKELSADRAGDFLSEYYDTLLSNLRCGPGTPTEIASRALAGLRSNSATWTKV